jgi:hypothetical protein
MANLRIRHETGLRSGPPKKCLMLTHITERIQFEVDWERVHYSYSAMKAVSVSGQITAADLNREPGKAGLMGALFESRVCKLLRNSQSRRRESRAWQSGIDGRPF